MKTVSIEAFEQVLEQSENNVYIFDTRAELLFKHDGLAGVKHLPLEQVQVGKLPEVAKDAAVYLICEYGQVSELVGLYLEAAAFSNVANVSGGMKAWRLRNKHFKLF